MKRCPITYEPFKGKGAFSVTGLAKLDRRLNALASLPITAEEQRREAIDRAGKMSIQGIQPKLSAVLKIKEQRFEIVDREGRFILKPPGLDFPELPENEDLTMHLAEMCGIETPFHALLPASDGSWTYCIRRFDREGRIRLSLEDFAQLSGATRETKYESSMEKVAGIVEKFCTFPVIEKPKLFTRALFSFLIGNEDMHLKNFSLIARGGRIDLSPAYDFLNSTIALRAAREEFALPVKGKKSRLTRKDLVDYFGRERLGISERIVAEILERFKRSQAAWEDWIERSFLSEAMKGNYWELLKERRKRLGIE